MSVVDVVAAQLAHYGEIVEAPAVRTNVELRAGELCRFTGSMPTYSDDDNEIDSVVSDIECALDLRHARMVLTEAHLFDQPNRNDPEVRMLQLELSVSILDGVLGFIDDDGHFIKHPFAADPATKPLANRAFELYLQSPFHVNPDAAEEVRTQLLHTHFEPAVVNRRADSPRAEHWHLVASSSATTPRERILERQHNGLELTKVRILGPRPVDKRPVHPQTGAVRAEFEDFMFSFSENLHRFFELQAAGQTFSQAARLVTCLTGVQRGTPYVQRAVVSDVGWKDASVSMFISSQSEDIEQEEQF